MPVPVLHYHDGGYADGLNVEGGHFIGDRCYEDQDVTPTSQLPSDAAEPVDDFDRPLTQTEIDELDAELLDNADYDEGFRDGSSARVGVYTFSVPVGTLFTLTVNG